MCILNLVIFYLIDLSNSPIEYSTCLMNFIIRLSNFEEAIMKDLRFVGREVEKNVWTNINRY